MLVQDFTYVDQPVAAVCERLRVDAPALFASLTEATREHADDTRLRVGPLGDAPLLSATVHVTCGAPLERGDTLILPVTWTAERLSSVLPVMQADLDVAPFGADRTQVTLMGRYEPPLGGVGRGIDRLLLHRVAQATVRAFLARLRLRLEDAWSPVSS